MNNTVTILFDLDETLIMEWESAKNSFIDTIAYLNHDLDKEKFVETIREEARLLWYSLPTINYCLKVGISSWEGLWADFDGNDKNIKTLKKYAADYRLNTWHNALRKTGIADLNMAKELSDKFKLLRNKRHILFPDTRSCLNKFKDKYKLGLITNGAPDIQWKKINGGNLKEYFTSIIISGEHGIGKPDPFLFDLAFSELKTKKNNSIMVGDSLSTDIRGANQTGLKCIWLNRQKRVNDSIDALPEFEIESLNELDAFI